jgi:hypothetical protein
MPLTSSQPGTLERLLGADRLERVLADLGATRPETVEGGGWVVVPGARGSGVAKRLAAGTVALAWHLGARLWVGAAEFHGPASEMAARLGLHPLR